MKMDGRGPQGAGSIEFEQQQAEGQAHGQEEAEPLAQALAARDQVVERPEAGRTAAGYGLCPEASRSDSHMRK